jgi:DNA-binding NtrC family response regulator
MAVSKSRQSRVRVLVVDDDEDMRALISELLALHFDVETAADVVDAEAKLADAAGRGIEYDVVITDYVMDGESGLALLSRLSTLQCDAAGLRLTAYSSLDIADEVDEAGRPPVLSKPFSSDTLIRRTAEIGASARARRIARRSAA